MTSSPRSPLLSVQDLTVGIGSGADAIDIVSELSIELAAGETLAIVGESGCGKTTAALSLIGLQPSAMSVRSGSVRFDGVEMTDMSEREYRRLRGGPMAMVFQDPMSSLNPLRRVGNQIGEALRIHQPGLSRSARAERVTELLRDVGIPDPDRRATQYPHEYSGGMRQRAMIAMAIANQPRLLIADEPTTALDVTMQAQIIELLVEAKETLDAALLLVTHDLGLVSELADRVVVMYSGRVVEQGPVDQILHNPQHPYTVGLLDSIPRLGGGERVLVPIPGQAPVSSMRPTGCAFHPRCSIGHDRPECHTALPELSATAESAEHRAACFFAGEATQSTTAARGARSLEQGSEPLLTIEDLHVQFPVHDGVLRRRVGTVRAVDGIDLTVATSETVAIVGESGSGKTSLARAIVGLNDIESGSILVEGLGNVVGKTDDPRFRQRVQLVFQDPFASLNPRMTLGSTIAEPLHVHGLTERSKTGERVSELLQLVGLPASTATRYPHELSGGQRQRIGLARALALMPDLIILDEPVSALDVSIQAQILALLGRLRDELGLAYVLIAHDLALVEQIADRVAVMYFGRIVELGTVAEVLGDPQHPYTRALIASTPGLETAGTVVRGEPPSPIAPPTGCAFRSRCTSAIDQCAEIDPALLPGPNGALVACIRSHEISTKSAAMSAPPDQAGDRQ